MVTVTENRIFDNRKISKTDNAIDDLGSDSSLFYNQFSSSSILMQGFTKVFWWSRNQPSGSIEEAIDSDSDDITDECAVISTESDSDVFVFDVAIAETKKQRRTLRKLRMAAISKMSVISESVEEGKESSTDDGSSSSSIILMSDSELTVELDRATVY